MRNSGLVESVQIQLAAAMPDISARLPAFVGLQVDAPKTLSRQRVLVIGAGSVGLNLFQHLGRLRIGTIYIADHGRFKPESLLTHPITPEFIGKPKASAAAELLKSISPTSRIFSFDNTVQLLPPSVFAEVDTFFLATDNLPAEVFVGQWAQNFNKLLIQPSVHGETLVAQVRTFLNADENSPCPRCLFNAVEESALAAGTRFSCEGAKSGDASLPFVSQPTMSTSSLCALAADLAMNVFLRHVLQLGSPLTDSMIEFAGYTARTSISPLQRNPDCPCGHEPWSIIRTERETGDLTVKELADAAGINDMTRASFNIAELHFIQGGTCACGKHLSKKCFGSPADPIGTCAACGRAITPDPLTTRRPGDGVFMADLANRPLREVCSSIPAWVWIRTADRTTLLYCPETA